MNSLFKSVHITKQSFHQYHNRLLAQLEEEEYLKMIIEEIRQNHPTMACRSLYFKIAPSCMGRDAFEEFCRYAGYTVPISKNYKRTTDSSGVKRFEDLATGLITERPNQLWTSDITYFDIGGRFYYLTFIIDVYTRRILGHSVSQRLFTEGTTLAALKRAIKVRKGQELSGLIFHSDGGGQYYDIDFLKLTNEYGIKNSMCKYPWQNPHAERINGIIKNNYLKHRKIKSFEDLVYEVDRSIKLYNVDKPHSGLNRMTPMEFENRIFASGKQSDGEKSATEYKTSKPEGIQPFGLRGNNPRTQISLLNIKPNV